VTSFTRRTLLSPAAATGSWENPVQVRDGEGGAVAREASDAMDTRGLKGFGQGIAGRIVVSGGAWSRVSHASAPPRQSMARLRQGERSHAMAGAENLQTSLKAAAATASPERSPTDRVDDVVDTGHPGDAGEHEVHRGVVLLHRSGARPSPTTTQS